MIAFLARRLIGAVLVLIADGQDRIVTAPWLAIIPGIAIVLTVLSLNVFGDGLRDALDPRAKVRMER